MNAIGKTDTAWLGDEDMMRVTLKLVLSMLKTLLLAQLILFQIRLCIIVKAGSYMD